MNRYLAFTGSHEYPAGGWADFEGDYPTIELAVADCEKSLALILKRRSGWWHVVDGSTGDIVASGHGAPSSAMRPIKEE